MNISVEDLQSLLSYDHSSGLIYWSKSLRKVSRIVPGAVAGAVNLKGYIQVSLRSKKYLAHRIAWALHHGQWPTAILDHIDGNKRNNKIENLRLVDDSGNQQNSTKARGSSELIGAFASRNGKFRSAIRVDGKQKYLGTFSTIEEANQAYMSAKKMYHPMHDPLARM